MVTVVKLAPHPDVVKEVVCRGCGATLSYVPNEVKTRTYKDYDGCGNVVEYITCPNCNKEVILREY